MAAADGGSGVVLFLFIALSVNFCLCNFKFFQIYLRYPVKSLIFVHMYVNFCLCNFKYFQIYFRYPVKSLTFVHMYICVYMYRWATRRS